MKKLAKTIAALMVAVICATGCTKPNDPNDPNNGGNNNGGNGGGNGGSLETGMYLGVIGFNTGLHTMPISRLDAQSIRETKSFIMICRWTMPPCSLKQ